ncbi:MAG: STAS domain-containing protein [Polyangiaceae bacterium]|nr:STAS domain-containing protein [Polyangiaceae bacterium]
MADLNEDDLEFRISNMLVALADAASGNFDARVETDLPSDDLVGALSRAVNEMIASLGDAERRRTQLRHELETKLGTIEAQTTAIRDLTTPIVEIWEGVLGLPVVGMVDTRRSVEMTEALLAVVNARRSKFVVVDITGIDVMDTKTVDHFIRMTKAVRLLGARCVLSGIHPDIAQTIVHMGLSMDELATHATLRDALQSYVTELEA